MLKRERSERFYFLVAYKDYTSSFVSLLEKDRSVRIHQKNVQLPMAEMFKTTNNLNSSFMDEIFLKRSVTCNLRNTNTFLLPMVHTVKYGTEQIRYRGQRIWHSLPQEIKDSPSVQKFKNKIKYRNNEGCDCRLCRQYIHRLGFL